MALVVFGSGDTITHTDTNANNNYLESKLANIVNANVASNAAIAQTKIAASGVMAGNSTLAEDIADLNSSVSAIDASGGLTAIQSVLAPYDGIDSATRISFSTGSVTSTYGYASLEASKTIVLAGRVSTTALTRFPDESANFDTAASVYAVRAVIGAGGTPSYTLVELHKWGTGNTSTMVYGAKVADYGSPAIETVRTLDFGTGATGLSASALIGARVFFRDEPECVGVITDVVANSATSYTVSFPHILASVTGFTGTSRPAFDGADPDDSCMVVLDHGTSSAANDAPGTLGGPSSASNMLVGYILTSASTGVSPTVFLPYNLGNSAYHSSNVWESAWSSEIVPAANGGTATATATFTLDATAYQRPLGRIKDIKVWMIARDKPTNAWHATLASRPACNYYGPAQSGIGNHRDDSPDSYYAGGTTTWVMANKVIVTMAARMFGLAAAGLSTVAGSTTMNDIVTAVAPGTGWAVRFKIIVEYY